MPRSSESNTIRLRRYIQLIPQADRSKVKELLEDESLITADALAGLDIAHVSMLSSFFSHHLNLMKSTHQYSHVKRCILEFYLDSRALHLARKVLNELQAVTLADSSITMLEARYHLATGDDEHAIQALSHVLGREPQNMEAMLRLSLLFYRREDFAKAVELLERYETILDGKGMPPQVYELLTVSLKKLGLIHRARDASIRYLKCYPEDAVAQSLAGEFEVPTLDLDFSFAFAGREANTIRRKQKHITRYAEQIIEILGLSNLVAMIVIGQVNRATIAVITNNVCDEEDRPVNFRGLKREELEAANLAEVRRRIQVIEKLRSLSRHKTIEIEVLHFAEFQRLFADNIRDSKRADIERYLHSVTVYDNGTIRVLNALWLLRQRILDKFSPYVVSFVISGSFVQRRSSVLSDLDLFIVVQDTDVKSMTLPELKSRLLEIISSKCLEIQRSVRQRARIHPQVYLLTDFIEGIQEGNPVYESLVLNGLPLYDERWYTPWVKVLERKRRSYPELGEQTWESFQQLGNKIRKETEELHQTLYFYMTTPIQSLFYQIGISPPRPKEMSIRLREELSALGMLDDEIEWVLSMYQRFIRYHKDIDYGIGRIDLSMFHLIELREKFERCLEVFRERLENRIASEDIPGLVAELYREITGTTPARGEPGRAATRSLGEELAKSVFVELEIRSGLESLLQRLGASDNREISLLDAIRLAEDITEIAEKAGRGGAYCHDDLLPFPLVATSGLGTDDAITAAFYASEELSGWLVVGHKTAASESNAKSILAGGSGRAQCLLAVHQRGRWRNVRVPPKHHDYVNAAPPESLVRSLGEFLAEE